jgi:hypothetical protein
MVFKSLLFLAVGMGLGFVSRPFIKTLQRRSLPTSELVQPYSDAEQVSPERLHAQLSETLLAYHAAVELGQFQAGFLARTSHELRSPLNAVISIHQLILSDLCDDGEEERQCLKQAYDAARKALGLLDELIYISKLSVGGIQLQLHPVHLDSVLKEVYRLTHLQAQNRNLRLTIEPTDESYYVLADSKRLQQVLIGLVETAIVSMNDGRIHMTVHRVPDSNYIQVVLEDDRPLTAWSEPLDLLNSTQVEASQAHLNQLLQEIRALYTPTSLETSLEAVAVQPTCLPPGFQLLISRALLEQMHGHLILEAVTSSLEANHPRPTYRLNCALPLAAGDVDLEAS